MDQSREAGQKEHLEHSERYEGRNYILHGRNMNIREEVIKINILYSSEKNEEKLLNAVERSIEELRNEWKINSKNFSKEDIVDLKRMASKLTAIKRLVYTISHPEDMRGKSYPLKATGYLRKLIGEVSGMAIEEKINIQIRNIIEHKSELLKSNLVVKPKSSTIKPKTLSYDKKKCVSCGENIPVDRINAVPNVRRCIYCQKDIEKKKPGIIPMGINEGIAWSRKDNIKMRKWRLS